MAAIPLVVTRVGDFFSVLKHKALVRMIERVAPGAASRLTKLGVDDTISS